ncbi:unnamed protein product [Ranitomeya imitator]|uniref:Uncharacterized protein n=1 Tax=Ranitomeya imitator TaxID=111125 RepID=A0ABN9LNS3_9NEOB|nr:unnamed protein product [Ranitomeya imitator]
MKSEDDDQSVSEDWKYVAMYFALLPSNRADKVRLCRSRDRKQRRGQHHMKMEGARPRRPSDRTASRLPLGYIGDLASAFLLQVKM